MDRLAPIAFNDATHNTKKIMNLSQFTKKGSLQETPATKKESDVSSGKKFLFSSPTILVLKCQLLKNAEIVRYILITPHMEKNEKMDSIRK
jgi:hypothetical protein